MTALRSAYEAAASRHEQDRHPIPPITEPMGRHWQQPDRSEILIDGRHYWSARRAEASAERKRKKQGQRAAARAPLTYIPFEKLEVQREH